MKPRTFTRTVGSTIAVVGLIFVLFKAGEMTWEQWSDWSKRSQESQILSRVDKSVSFAPMKPAPALPQGYSVFILCYHDFGEKPSKWSITPQRLEAHLQTLKDLGFSFLTVSEAVDLMTGRWHGDLPERAVVVTVDDGFRSAYTILFPLLKRYEAKATLFVYTDWIGKTSRALTWEQLREMAQSGLVEIASHTVTHTYPRLLKRMLSREQFRQRMLWEFAQSKKELEGRLGVNVNGLAYPGGQTDGTIKELAKEAGYRWAVAINPEPMTVNSDLYSLPRYGVNSETFVATLKTWVTKQPIQLVRHSKQSKKVSVNNANSLKPSRKKHSSKIARRSSPSRVANLH